MFDGASSLSVCNKDYIIRSWEDTSIFPDSFWKQTSICCSAGKWSSTVGITRVEDCEADCPAGKWSSLVGITRVEDCENADCPTGKWSSLVGITLVEDC